MRSVKTTTRHDIEIPPRDIPPARLVTAKSFMINRFTPDCEVVELPARQMEGGRIEIESGVIRAGLPIKGRNPVRRLKGIRTEAVPEGHWIFDARPREPENWAHFLNNHLPLFFRAAEATGRDQHKAILLLPQDIPGYIIRAAELFGLRTRATDAQVEGEGVSAVPRPRTALRAARVEWASGPLSLTALEAGLARARPELTPKRVFLARRDTRRVSNLSEIETILHDGGFETVFAETLSPAGQFRLFRDCEAMVAVHGAALAPLLYRQPGQGPQKLVEILPVGHMTDVYRAICAQVGIDWIGVRGRLKPEYVKAAYDFETPYKMHSLDDFEVDPVALTRAFEMVGL